MQGLYRGLLGLYGDTGKENGNYPLARREGKNGQEKRNYVVPLQVGRIWGIWGSYYTQSHILST